MNYRFREAHLSDSDQIWTIIKTAIARRKSDGSDQWQDGYPNPEVIRKDIERNAGFVLTENDDIIGYAAVLINDEPAYAEIKGNWQTNADFVVFHRVAIAEGHIRKGLAKRILQFIEDFARGRGIYSIKADTNFDNLAMLKTFNNMGYIYCGEIYLRGGARKAFEKVLDKLRTQ